MNTTGGKKKVISAEFASLLKTAEEAKMKSKNKKKGQSRQNPNLFQGVVFNTKEKVKDYNFECGCFGSRHSIVNNCVNCGRIICELEGERPCPYCGVPVFSDATLNDPERLSALEAEIKAIVDESEWIPLSKRVLQPSVEPPKVSTEIYDLEKDWFDDEISQICNDVQ